MIHIEKHGENGETPVSLQDNTVPSLKNEEGVTTMAYASTHKRVEVPWSS